MLPYYLSYPRFFRNPQFVSASTVFYLTSVLFPARETFLNEVKLGVSDHEKSSVESIHAGEEEIKKEIA